MNKNKHFVEILQLRAKFQTAMVSSYRLKALSPSGLGNDFVCKRFAVQTILWLLKFAIQKNLEHDTIPDILFNITIKERCEIHPVKQRNINTNEYMQITKQCLYGLNMRLK